jgi:tRNA nucleotidyltransferase (CCA-adding enzyme)
MKPEQQRILTDFERAIVERIIDTFKLNLILRALQKVGAQPYLVGGVVRDLLLKKTFHDIDIEVHNIDEQAFVQLLKGFGSVALQGKSFGVFRLTTIDVDWSLPRVDGPGRHPLIHIDPYMGIKKALLRRDITINAMAIDLFSMVLIDPFFGEYALQQSSIRAVCPQTFVEDPLRLYRVMQFVARFAMQPDEQLNTLCRSIDLQGVARERIEQEFIKMFLLSTRPSLGIRWLHVIGRLNELYPELGMLVGVQQSPLWHPEGDVFEHTMQVLDAIALIPQLNSHDRIVLSWAALCHDMGKVVTTKKHPHDGRIISYGHEVAGLSYAASFLRRITNTAAYSKKVLRLVEYHMRPCALVRGHAGAAAYKRLAHAILPISMRFLALFARADKRGRNGTSSAPFSGAVSCVDRFEALSLQYGVLDAPLSPLITGYDLLAAGINAREIGTFLAKAYQYQLSREGITRNDILRYLGIN